MLTTFWADEHVVEALRAGASVLVKDAPPLDNINAVRLVARGEDAISPLRNHTLLAHFGDTQARARRHVAVTRLATSTDCEREVATCAFKAPVPIAVHEATS